jgi:branched-chain amino acid transport system ATP-binding protein
MIEHRLCEFMQLVNRVIAMGFDEIITVGPSRDIVQNPRVVEAYIGRVEASSGTA